EEAVPVGKTDEGAAGKGFRQFTSFSQALSDPRIGLATKVKLGALAGQIKATRNPAQVRAILERNRALIDTLIRKGLITARDVEEADARLREMEQRGESFDFRSLLQ
ncbi:MAG: hypothetical protein NUV35_02590, partial [Syntrophomonadaceae bacterium]|nr:hypothetical protein [Syntrophomonadaceae bacterium]